MAKRENLVRLLRVETADQIPSVLAPLRAEAGIPRSVAVTVADLLAEVRRSGDAALVRQVRAFDWPCPGPDRLRVPTREMTRAWEDLGRPLRAALLEAERSVRAFHAGQRPAACLPIRRRGLRAEIEVYPLDSVGLYIPGGRAAYPSTLLMLAVPALVAGVRRIAVACPAGRNGLPDRTVLAAAHLLGTDEVYALGGAAAVGAFAYGTTAVPRVDKILGPGNAFVAEAKRQVFGEVGVDAIAGPTELVVLSDGSSPPGFVAADLLAQAEHDPLAQAVLLTTDPDEPARVLAQLGVQLRASPRAAIQRRSLGSRGALVTCADRAIACAAARQLAPEHLSVQARTPRRWAREVPTAAAVFLGPYAPEAAGDYGAGPNHSLPTGGTARFSSPVGVWDFVRYRSSLELTRGALGRMAPWMEDLARAEGLEAHAASVAVRRGTP